MDALNQKDVDSLLRGAPRASAPQRVDVVPYNFRRPPRISRERQATLDGIYTRFALSLQSLLSQRLRQPTDVTVASVEQATFAEFTMSLGTPCASYIYDLGEQVGAQAVVDLDPVLAPHFVDRLFGGPGGAVAMQRPLTSLEQLVLGNVTDRLMILLQESFGDHVGLNPSQVSFESMPETLQIANREDNVLVGNLEVKSGSTSGLLTICIPLEALESFLQEKAGPVVSVTRARRDDRDQARSLVEAHLRSARVPVQVRLSEFPLAAIDVATLHEGQVLSTGQVMHGEVEVHVNGRRLFFGTLGRQQGYLGLRITQPAEPLGDTGRPSRRRTQG